MTILSHHLFILVAADVGLQTREVFLTSETDASRNKSPLKDTHTDTRSYYNFMKYSKTLLGCKAASEIMRGSSAFL